MKWHVVVPWRVSRQLANLPEPEIRGALISLLIQMERNPTPSGEAGTIDSVRNGWRIKIGNWRMLYLVVEEEAEIYVGDIVRRSDTTYSKARLRRLASRARRNPDV